MLVIQFFFEICKLLCNLPNLLFFLLLFTHHVIFIKKINYQIIFYCIFFSDICFKYSFRNLIIDESISFGQSLHSASATAFIPNIK